ncbi:MAG TPA: sulfotransferase, partial [Planctomycetaceae bacterium]
MGITTGDWLALLARNGFRIPPRFWLRTSFSTLVSLVNTAWYYTAEAALSHSVARQQVLPPVFILGHWRSGTTHLHNLLSLDERFAYPKFAQIMIPKTFLTGEW